MGPPGVFPTAPPRWSIVEDCKDSIIRYAKTTSTEYMYSHKIPMDGSTPRSLEYLHATPEIFSSVIYMRKRTANTLE